MLAIIIPYYKLTFFKATLDSLREQTDKRFKVYIGNDASPENPEELLKNYDSFFEYDYKKFDHNFGKSSLVKQWNRCVEMIGSEDYILILGDDDILGKNCVEEFYKNFDDIKETSNVIRFASVKIDSDGKETSHIYTNPVIEKATDFLFRKTRSSLSEYIFRKSSVEQVGFKDFPLAWMTDVLAVIEVAGFKNIYSINTAVVSFRISELNISGKQDNLKPKAAAVFQFFYYLINEKADFFTKHQQLQLYSKLNKTYLNDKKNVTHFFLISKIYISRRLLVDYIRFITSIVKSFYN